ncbi:trypsin-like peptidase domain-containing protein [Candidatus Saccharibacteria bacterium]|nr:trypsin-like peptidase domain-containing protein [Candidatus Saccharibacteria bacterium]
MDQDEQPIIGAARIKKNQAAKSGDHHSSNKNHNSLAIVLAIIAIIIGCGGFAYGALMAYRNSQPRTVSDSATEDGYYAGNLVEFEETSIAAIVQKVTPAVVSIVSETNVRSFYASGTAQSAGTGMIVSADGYVLTNKHVVEGSRNIQVVTNDGDTYEDVEVVGVDPLNDVAYLKIADAKDLPAITLGDSKTIAVGQPVLAIGNALGAYQNTVTQGIVSGTGRSVDASDSTGSSVEKLTDMIQTDAAINPGNSGGPLVNANGDVIGINTAVADANGMGFSIPISAVKGMLNNIIKNDKAERAYLGVSYIPVTAEVAKQYELPVKHGAYVYTSSSRSSAVADGGPAAKAGIEDGDIITKVGDIEVGSAGSISTLIGEYMPGDSIELTYIRGDKTYSTTAKLTAYED